LARVSNSGFAVKHPIERLVMNKLGNSSVKSAALWACWTVTVLSVHAIAFLAVLWLSAGATGMTH